MTEIVQVRRSDGQGGSWATYDNWASAGEFLWSRFHAYDAREIRLREVQPDETEFGRRLRLSEGMKKLHRRLYSQKVGTIMAVATSDMRAIWRVRRVEVGLRKVTPAFSSAYPLSQWVPELQETLKMAAGYDYGVRCNGGAYTRLVTGTSTWSRHSKRRNRACKGEAADLTFPLPMPVGNDIGRQRRLVNWALAHVDELQLTMMISERTYYHRENDFDGRYYSGVAHVSHTHWETYPLDNGPVCP